MDSGPIQVIPPGLLGFLQIKNNGQNPSLLPDSIQPVMDLQRWLFNGRLEVATGTNLVPSAGAPADITLFTIPEREWFWIENVTCSVVALAAGDDLAANISYVVSPGGTSSMYAIGPTGSTGVALLNQRLIVSANGFFVPPGAAITLSVTRKALAADRTYNAALRGARLPI